jgi:Protein of unknown function (DUF3168)
MSIETDFRALLAAHAPLVALVATRIAQDAAPEGSQFPLVVFSASHDRTLSLSGIFQADQCTLSVQCWAETGMQANEVADAVAAAIAAAPVTTDVCVLSRATTFDPDLGADGILLGVEWWDTP